MRDLLSPEFLEHPCFRLAVTHRSANRPDNERLEFLGDAVLQLVISELLYSRFADENEGELSRLRAHLVRKETLAALARECRMGEWMQLGRGEIKTGGRGRESNLANLLEAIIGALYLVEGFQAAKEFTGKLFADRIEDLPAVEHLKDPKTKLQEQIQLLGYGLPRYQAVDESRKGGDVHFEVKCVVAELGISVSGQGASKRKAEQAAAACALELIRSKPA